jgi:VWFA-related protein
MLLVGGSDVVRVQQQAADLKSFYTDQQEKATLEALRQIAQYLGTIPGRKNLIWFSGAFPLNIDPPVSDSRITMKDPVTGETVMDYCNPHPMRTTRDYDVAVRETDRLLTAARVAVYPIDAQGLVGQENSFSASTSQASVLCLAAKVGATEQTRQIINFQRQAGEEHQHEQSTMQQIAEDTGGKAFVNTNGFQAALQQALNDGANYYTIGYAPEGKDDGQFRHIKVKLDGGYDLDYRDGYYADAQGRGPGSGATAMREAVEFGAPLPSEIPFKVRVIAASDPAANGITPAAGPAGANAKDLKPPVTRYLIDYMIDAHSFAFNKTEDGLEHAQLEFSVVAYDADGKRINVTDNAFAFGMTPAIYAQVMSGGFPRHLEIDLPAGQVSLRIVVHDMNSAKAGATVVPLTVAKQ